MSTIPPEPLASSPLPKLLESQMISEGFLQLYLDRLVNDCGQEYTYYTLKTRSHAAVILAETAVDTYVVNREYRHPTGKYLLSLPGGFLDGDEDPCSAAARELLEETGYSAAHFVSLGAAYPYPGISNQKIYYILAREASLVAPPSREPGELMVTTTMSLASIRRAILDGEPIDANLCTAIYLHTLLPHG